MNVSRVFECPERFGPANSSVNPSLSFITAHHCLFTSGCDSCLYILYTPSRKDLCNAENSKGIDAENHMWQSLAEYKLSVRDSGSVQILSANYDETNHLLDVVTLVLSSGATAPSRVGKVESKPPIATYHWHRLSIDLVLSSSLHVSSNDNVEAKAPLVTTASVLSTLHSSTIALYTSFIADHLIILSEADVGPLNTSTDGSEKDKEAGDNDSTEEEMTDEPEKEKSKFSGLGFGMTENKSTMPSQIKYEWSQTESDVTITIVLSDDVTKHDIHCVIDRREVVVGLTDGTTFFRGQLFAAISPDCSTWTIDNHTYV